MGIDSLTLSLERRSRPNNPPPPPHPLLSHPTAYVCVWSAGDLRGTPRGSLDRSAIN